MKSHINKSKIQCGGVLIVTLLFCVILGIMMGSYLSLIKAQRFSVARSQVWNSAIVVAEAGIEEAMAHLNSGVNTNNLAVNSWVGLGVGTYAKTNFVANGYSVVTKLVLAYVPTPRPTQE